MTQYNECPRCIRSGVGACDDFPDCQPPREPAEVTDYILTPDGGIFQLNPLPEFDYDELRRKLAEATPEERIAAAQHYIHARYDAALPEGLVELFGAAYPESPDGDEPSGA